MGINKYCLTIFIESISTGKWIKKKLTSAIKRFDPKTIPDIEEVNMFRDDNTVVHMKKPQVQYSFKEQLLVLQGNPETKNLKDMLPEILKQVGPQQFNYLN